MLFVIAFGVFLLLAFVGLPLLILSRQTAAAHAELGVTGTSAWTEAGFEKGHARGLRLVRVVPADRTSVAEFQFLDVDGHGIGTLTFADQVRATIAWNGKVYEKYAQSSGAFKTGFSGKVGGTSDRSIVVREGDTVAAEIFSERAGLGFTYRIVSGDKTYVAARSEVSDSGELVAQYRSPSALSQSGRARTRTATPRRRCGGAAADFDAALKPDRAGPPASFPWSRRLAKRHSAAQRRANAKPPRFAAPSTARCRQATTQAAPA